MRRSLSFACAFGLIMDAALKASDNAWANVMFNRYIEGVFPC